MQLNKQQQQQFAEMLNTRLDRMTMSWDNELREWYPMAKNAIRFSSPARLRVPQDKFITLLQVDKHGVNMNVVMALSNNLEYMNAEQLGISVEEFAELLLLNTKVAHRWQELANPVQQSALKEIEIMAAKPKMEIIN